MEKRFNIQDKNKIKVIYNFVSKDERLEELRFNKPHQKPISIVYAGATSVHKSPELVAKIVAKLLNTDLDFRFIWTGKTTIPLTTKLLKFSKLKDVRQILPVEDPRLIFPGRIPSKSDYDILLGSANVFLAPSKNEGCSMAILEAHRSGCILLVADYKNSNREIVEAGKSGFVVNHNDIDEFVRVISDIIKNHSEYTEYYENSHDAFEKLLSYPVWRSHIIDTLNSEQSHKRRKTKVINTRLYCDIIRMKWYAFSRALEQLLLLSIPSYFSFLQQYRSLQRKG